MTRTSAALLALTTMLSAACSDKRPALQIDRDTVVAFDTTQSDPASDDTLSFERRRTIDFNGDGDQETILLRGRGPRWDAMNMDLIITAPDGHVLYVDSFTTTRYTGLDAEPMQQPAIDSIVKRELEAFLSDEAFMPTAAHFDDANVDLRAHYAREKGVPEEDIPVQEYQRFEQDIMQRTMFRYYIGGESSIGITWSAILGEFVVTFNCC